MRDGPERISRGKIRTYTADLPAVMVTDGQRRRVLFPWIVQNLLWTAAKAQL